MQELNSNKSLFECLSSGKELEFKTIIEKLKAISEELTLTELIDKVLDATGMRQELESEGTLEAGSFYHVQITDAAEFDLYATLLKN